MYDAVEVQDEAIASIPVPELTQPQALSRLFRHCYNSRASAQPSIVHYITRLHFLPAFLHCMLTYLLPFISRSTGCASC